MKNAESIALPLPAGVAAAGWGQALRGALVLMALCGALYPLATVLVGSTLFPRQSTGSLIEQDGEVVGSSLVGQPFAAPGYFQGRPSACGYDPFAASGSNLAPSNPDLRKRAQATSQSIAEENRVAPAQIPGDLIAASGSGIDPHISPAAARLQIPRVAAARGLHEAALAALVEAHVERPSLGVLGQPRVNVLKLNLALDQAAARP